jgi:Tol biopolymer transport system component
MMSPDGRLLLATGTPSRDPGLWLVDLKANASTRLGSDGIGPLWSPDGHRIAFTAQGGLDIFTSSTVGRTDNRLLLHDDTRKVLQTWSPDGRFMVFTRRTPETQLDLWLLPVSDPSHATRLLATPANEKGAAISPDGHWIAYTSDESGQSEVYLQEFPGLGSKRVVSTGGGAGAYWRGDGNELFYVAPDRSLMAVDVNLATSPAVGKPRALFRAPLAGEASEARNHFVASPDGKTFLVNVADDSSERGGIAVMLNWKARLTAPKRETVGARLRARGSRAIGIS